MKIKSNTTITRKGDGRNHFGTSDIRFFQTGHCVSWKRSTDDGAIGSAILELTSNQPDADAFTSNNPTDYERWLYIRLAEHSKKSSRETMITLRGDTLVRPEYIRTTSGHREVNGMRFISYKVGILRYARISECGRIFVKQNSNYSGYIVRVLYPDGITSYINRPITKPGQRVRAKNFKTETNAIIAAQKELKKCALNTQSATP